VHNGATECGTTSVLDPSRASPYDKTAMNGSRKPPGENSPIDLSVVVCTYVSKPQTIEIVDKLLLPSLARNADRAMELVLVDDASPMHSDVRTCLRAHRDRLESGFGRVVIEFRAENYGFAKGYNAATRLATGRSLIIANSDLYFPSGALRRLAHALDSDAGYAIVGPVTNDCYSQQKVSLLDRLRDYEAASLDSIEAFARFVRDAGVGVVPAEYLSGFCLAIRRETAVRVGPFDESFREAYFEDYDLCYRVRREGRLMIDGATYVHHGGLEGGSSALWHQRSAIWNTLRFARNGARFARRHGAAEWLRQMWRQNRAYRCSRCNLTHRYEQARRQWSGPSG